MAKSVIVWTCITYFCYILPSVCEGAMKKSKACFGSVGLPWAKHNIACSSNQKIAIYDAYYTNNSKCKLTGISDCVAVNPNILTEHGYHRFSNHEMMSLYNTCSTATKCAYLVPRRISAFSVVKYLCINGDGDSLNISGGSSDGLSQVSLFHRDEVLPSSTIQTSMYVCRFKSRIRTTSPFVFLLDARLGLGTRWQCFSQLSVLRGYYITTSNCSAVFQPFERLNVTQEITLNIYSKDIPRVSPGLVWPLVNASHSFDVTCETVERRTTGSSRKTASTMTHNVVSAVTVDNSTDDAGALTEPTVSHVSSTDHITLSGSSRITALSMTHTVLSAVTANVSTYAAVKTKTTFRNDVEFDPSKKTGSNTGAIAGGVVATVLAVLVVTLVSVWIIRRRRQNGEVNETTSSLPKDAKPDMTYSLAGNITQNNYHEIQTVRTENGDYDYATADGMVLPPTSNTYFIIEPAGKETAGDNSKSYAAEGDYDHIGDKPSPQTSDYDTTASVVQPGHIGEDGYGYNHFQKKANPHTHHNAYDTACLCN